MNLRNSKDYLLPLAIIALGAWTYAQHHATRQSFTDSLRIVREAGVDRMRVEVEVSHGRIATAEVERRPGETDDRMANRLAMMLEFQLEALK